MSRRGKTDYRKAYATACRYELVRADDVHGVARFLRCSLPWARELTREARAKAAAQREAEIEAKRAEGKSNRQIARETGIPSRTVDRIGAPKRNSFDLAQPATLIDKIEGDRNPGPFLPARRP